MTTAGTARSGTGTGGGAAAAAGDGASLIESAGTNGWEAPAETGFELFFDANHARIERALILTLGDREFGEDAAAEGFARALQRWSIVGTYANPGGWVYRVALNWAQSRVRRIRRDRFPAGGRRSGNGTAHTSIESVTSDLVLAAALEALTIEHRAVVVARYVLDRSEADVAEMLDIPVGTVKSRLSRALTRLATLLEESDD